MDSTPCGPRRDQGHRGDHAAPATLTQPNCAAESRVQAKFSVVPGRRAGPIEDRSGEGDGMLVPVADRRLTFAEASRTGSPGLHGDARDEDGDENASIKLSEGVAPRHVRRGR
jgi:hypothetical protein